jgi:hypothetical protein
MLKLKNIHYSDLYIRINGYQHVINPGGTIIIKENAVSQLVKDLITAGFMSLEPSFPTMDSRFMVKGVIDSWRNYNR